jgi:acetolactate synthase-1/2/3 large subunit
LNDDAPVGEKHFGSDAIADAMRALDLRYVALNPGASYRGLHDSIVNHLGNEDPTMLLCLHEEAAVAIAHGYAKVLERPIGVIVHSVVGLMHASMAIFNAWCDRVPIVIFGATGPLDAAIRRPWIDWIHTTVDQAALVRNYTKWDDQPGSPAAAVESVLRAGLIAKTPPRGPVFVTFDAALQEGRYEETLTVDAARYAQPVHGPHPDALATLTARLNAARMPVILAGRVSRDDVAWTERIALAERLGAQVLTDGKLAAAFPSHHPLHPHPPMFLPTPAGLQTLREADVVLALDWATDLGNLLQSAFGNGPRPFVASASLDFELHRGWNMEYMPLAPVDLAIAAEPDVVVHSLLAALGPRTLPVTASIARTTSTRVRSDVFSLGDIADGISVMLEQRATTIVRLPIGWSWANVHIGEPLDYLGYDGGAGIGSGPGVAVGAALALRDLDSGRLPLAVLGDGDFLMGGTAIWTAANNTIPLLVIVANNRSYFNDELHQERVAESRGRPRERRWIGQRIDGPAVDIAAFARSLGATGFGPCTDRATFDRALVDALAVVDAGGVAVIDAVVLPAYDPATTATMTGGEARS